MSSIQLQHPTAIRIAATCTLAGPLTWWVLEYWTSRGYKPSYSYMTNFTSDLAVPYPFKEITFHRPAESTRHPVMKFCFFAKATLTAIGHFSLLRATGGMNPLSFARAVCTLVYVNGIVLVALVPGGPREHASGAVFWHSLGALTGFMGANLYSILAGVANTDPLYRRASIFFGTAGIVNTVIFVLMGRTKVRGLWQRACINSIHAFELLTAWTLLSQLSGMSKASGIAVKQH